MNAFSFRWAAALAAVAISGCATLATSPGAAGSGSVLRVAAGTEDSVALPEAIRLSRPGKPGIDFLLLGEIHDNPTQHRLRRHWLGQLLERSGPFVLAMEQLDTGHQRALDRALAEGLPAEEVARAGGFDFRGWGWPLYRPFFEFAVKHHIRLVAANLSREEAAAIVRGEPNPLSAVRPSDWSASDEAAQDAEIRAGHCGMLPEHAVAPMAQAQRARDAKMAEVLYQARADTGLPVVLLAGNGHVRRDRGVPRYLKDLAPGARVFSVGLLENVKPGEAAGWFDLLVSTPAHPREDPCVAFRARMKQMEGARPGPSR